MNTKHRGANGFQLKLLALITMTMDHIAVYLPGAPDWFHYAGRLAAPIFLYLCMEGFFYTHSRTRHLARMYILSSLMKAGSLALCLTLPRGTGLTNDIFSTMFVSCWIVQGMELIRSPEGRRKRQGMLMLAGTAAATAAFLLVYSNFERVPLNLLRLVNILLPNPISCEGGFVIVILGVLFYYTRRSRLGIVLWLGALSTVYLLALPLELPNVIYVLCIFAAVIPILLYNGTPGAHRCKYLFYLYYPAHVYILYSAGWLVENRLFP